MPTSTTSSLLAVSFLAGAAATASTYLLWEYYTTRSEDSKREKRRVELRQQLPTDLTSWRYSDPVVSDYEKGEPGVWGLLQETIREHGYTLWRRAGDSVCIADRFYQDEENLPEMEKPSGYSFVHPARNSTDQGPGTVRRLCDLEFLNDLYRPATSEKGLDVVLRVIVVKSDGRNHLDILRNTATGTASFWSNNHCLPLLDEIIFDDIVLGVFPKVSGAFRYSYGFWAKDSVGDVLEMIMQMLEALEFIHGMNIAHRDAFQDNFLVQWQPESLLTNKISPSRPRVYLTDFETAIQFPRHYKKSECLVTGLPLAGSIMNEAKYARPRAPECMSGSPYSPFKLDVWQLGISLRFFKTTLPSIDRIIEDMKIGDPALHPTSGEALDKLRGAIYAMPPESLLFAPEVLPWVPYVN
ncbi:hypothetical protein D9613_006198 [Agrocybe pediades]|uniref:Protein kinase domain-containing protein n=1 Tax=Agrocybe pediades TaxID=84607 RepID=A0A8H4QV84_9AGAR|nr:hypothetical protein D9613_006198 [Agrocybe pediades]